MEGPEEAKAYNENSAFLNLPEIVVEKIIGYLSYNEIAQNRIVCYRFNQINKRLLNIGFRLVRRYLEKVLKELISQLPHHLFEKTKHPLFRHWVTLKIIEHRLNLLNSTFIKYVDCSMCCFIPGKVIDEIYRLLKFISSKKTVPVLFYRPLLLISDMAINHFNEKTVHLLKLNTSMAQSTATPGTSRTVSTSRNISPPTPGSTYQMSKLMGATNNSSDLANSLMMKCQKLESKQRELKRKVSQQERVILKQKKIMYEQSAILTSQENKMNKINCKLVAPSVPKHVSAVTHSDTALPLTLTVTTTGVMPQQQPQPHGNSIADPQPSTSAIKDFTKEKEYEASATYKKYLHREHNRHLGDHNIDGRPNKIRKKELR